MAAFSFQESLGHCVRGKVGQIFVDLPQLSPDRLVLRYANDQFADTLLPAQPRTQADCSRLAGMGRVPMRFQIYCTNCKNALDIKIHEMLLETGMRENHGLTGLPLNCHAAGDRRIDSRSHFRRVG
jgi:hypothetical protein